MPEERFISVVIPNRNGAATISRCLGAALASDYPRFEVVVVDDGSEDASVDIIETFPCKLVRLGEHRGVSRARNAGARASAGELLLFTDSDCLLRRDTLAVANASYGGGGGDRVLGGTYTTSPFDADFFSAFQSIFINHFETKRVVPDYVASHAMVVDADLFRRSGGFIEGSRMGVAPSLEDVEFCHHLRRTGCQLAMDPDFQVQHIFGFSLWRSVRNAIRKARWWTMYSMANRDLLADSGTASLELKTNVAAGFFQLFLLASALAGAVWWPMAAMLPVLALDLAVNRHLIGAWSRARGRSFAVLATLYYLTIYAAAVGLGAAAGALRYPGGPSLLRRCR